MLAYILEITKGGNKGIASRGSLRNFKAGQKYRKSGQRFQIGAGITYGYRAT